tara:strand:+ start:299 stop:706 length:408 start_codon:yes stop_codon:yes gene_type:complete
MTFEKTLNSYRELLESNKGFALDLGLNTVAVIVDGDLKAAHYHAEGRIELENAFEFDEDNWDQESDCWDGELSASETIGHITNPSFIKIHPEHQEALRALRAGEWDCPALADVGPLTHSYPEQVTQIVLHYGMQD